MTYSQFLQSSTKFDVGCNRDIQCSTFKIGPIDGELICFKVIVYHLILQSHMHVVQGFDCPFYRS